MDVYADKLVVVTGGTGMIGRQLVEMLLKRGARVRVASLDDPSLVPADVDFRRVDLTELGSCLEICDGADQVFHLAGVKGSPAMTAERPASFFVPTLMFNTNVMEAARRCGVDRYLFTSTIGVYAPAEVFHEDDVWHTFPSPHDRFAGWAKRMGELQAQAYAIEHGWDRIAIVRPANVYGPWDNFDPENAMVIPSLVHRAVSGERPLRVWGDGSPVRDFIHARDVARGMLVAMERGLGQVLNLGSGGGTSIRRLVERVVGCLPDPPEVVWDPSRPSGDPRRVMDVSRAVALGFRAEIPLDEGVREVVEWYREHRSVADRRYNAFRDERFGRPRG